MLLDFSDSNAKWTNERVNEQWVYEQTGEWTMSERMNGRMNNEWTNEQVNEQRVNERTGEWTMGERTGEPNDDPGVNLFNIYDSLEFSFMILLNQLTQMI